MSVMGRMLRLSLLTAAPARLLLSARTLKLTNTRGVFVTKIATWQSDLQMENHEFIAKPEYPILTEV